MTVATSAATSAATSEPTYMYRPGEGWVPEPPDVITMSCGTRVRAIFGYPEHGQRYLNTFSRDSCYHNGDGVLSDGGRACISQKLYTQLRVCEPHQMPYISSEYTIITLVVVV